MCFSACKAELLLAVDPCDRHRNNAIQNCSIVLRLIADSAAKVVLNWNSNDLGYLSIIRLPLFRVGDYQSFADEIGGRTDRDVSLGDTWILNRVLERLSLCLDWCDLVKGAKDFIENIYRPILGYLIWALAEIKRIEELGQGQGLCVFVDTDLAVEHFGRIVSCERKRAFAESWIH